MEPGWGSNERSGGVPRKKSNERSIDVMRGVVITAGDVVRGVVEPNKGSNEGSLDSCRGSNEEGGGACTVVREPHRGCTEESGGTPREK